MTDEQRVYIRGVQDRGKEVIKALEDYGASNSCGYIGDEAFIYFIRHDGIIDFVCDDTEYGKIIIDNYTELHLPEKWKDGDVLVSDEGLFFVLRGDFELGVKKEYADAYCCVSEHQICLSGHFGQIGYPHLASPSEVEHFHELMHKYGKDWDAEKKQVVDWRWKPKKEEDYWAVILDTTIIKLDFTWLGSVTDEIRYKLGNCFRTREEAEAAAERVRKALKGETL